MSKCIYCGSTQDLQPIFDWVSGKRKECTECILTRKHKQQKRLNNLDISPASEAWKELSKESLKRISAKYA